ncbi:MAG: T9SS type A sorting domain-containing protein [Bacteroidales bacterium]
MVDITLVDVTNTTVEVNFAPNAACASYYILIGTADQMTMFSAMFGVPIDSLVHRWGVLKDTPYTQLWSGQDAATEYTIYASPMDESGDVFPLQTLIVTTLSGGGSGLSEIDLQVSEITAQSVRLIATPNDQTAVFHNGLITVSYYNEIGADQVNEYFKTDGQPLYETDNWTWIELIPETAYYAIGIGQNADGVWGPAARVEFTTLSEIGIRELDGQQSKITLFPNPSSGTFNFKSLDQNSGIVSIYNNAGQKVHEQKVSGFESSINANGLENGLYHVIFNSKDSGKITTQKLIIRK